VDLGLESENSRNSCSVATFIQASLEVTHYKKSLIPVALDA
jgi:hypothetical protein